LHIHPSEDREKPLMPAKSTTIQRIEAQGLETKQDGAFDHAQRSSFSTELEKAIVASLESWRMTAMPADSGRTTRGCGPVAHVAAGLTTLKEAIRQALV
jgi:hypothetical protein